MASGSAGLIAQVPRLEILDREHFMRWKMALEDYKVLGEIRQVKADGSLATVALPDPVIAAAMRRTLGDKALDAIMTLSDQDRADPAKIDAKLLQLCVPNEVSTLVTFFDDAIGLQQGNSDHVDYLLRVEALRAKGIALNSALPDMFWSYLLIRGLTSDLDRKVVKAMGVLDWDHAVCAVRGLANPSNTNKQKTPLVPEDVGFAVSNLPVCWLCGKAGHFKKDCHAGKKDFGRPPRGRGFRGGRGGRGRGDRGRGYRGRRGGRDWAGRGGDRAFSAQQTDGDESADYDYHAHDMETETGLAASEVLVDTCASRDILNAHLVASAGVPMEECSRVFEGLGGQRTEFFHQVPLAKFVVRDVDGNQVVIPIKNAAVTPEGPTLISKNSLDGLFVSKGLSWVETEGRRVPLQDRRQGPVMKIEKVFLSQDGSQVEEEHKRLGHPRVAKMIDTFKEKGEWCDPSLIKEVVTPCKVCHLNKIPLKPMQKGVTPEETGKLAFRVSIDVMFVDKEDPIKAVVVVDHGTRCIAVQPVKTRQSDEVLRAFHKAWRRIVERTSMKESKPGRIRMDKDKSFNQLRRWAEDNNIKVEDTASYSPWSNGLNERTHGTLGAMVRCLLQDADLPRRCWPWAIEYAAERLNEMAHSALEDSKGPRTPNQAAKREDVKEPYRFGKIILVQTNDYKTTLEDRWEDGQFLKKVHGGEYHIFVLRTKKVVSIHPRRVREGPLPSTGKEPVVTPEVVLPPEGIAVPEDDDLVVVEEGGGEQLEGNDGPGHIAANVKAAPRVRRQVQSLQVRPGQDASYRVVQYRPTPGTSASSLKKHLRRAQVPFCGIPAKKGETVYAAVVSDKDEKVLEQFAVEKPKKVTVKTPFTAEERRQSRKVELDGWRDRLVYSTLTEGEGEALRAQGAQLMTTLWVEGRKDNLEAKSRLCIRGYSDKRQPDPSRTSSPTPRLLSLRVLVMIASMKGVKALTMADVRQAFLNADRKIVNPNDCILIRALPESGDTGYWAILKAAYGLKEAPQAFHDDFAMQLKGQGYEPLQHDPCVFVKHDGDDVTGINVILAHVDDAAGLGSAVMKDLKDIPYTYGKGPKSFQKAKFIGFTLELSPDGWVLHQCQFAKELAKDVKVGRHAPDTPLPVTLNLNQDESGPVSREQHEEYRSGVGKLAWLAGGSRPDLQYAVSMFSRYLQAPTLHLLHLVRRCIHYASGVQFGILYSGFEDPEHIELVAFSDSTWASVRDASGGFSMTGYVISVKTKTGYAPLVWRSVRQRRVARSSGSAELIAMEQAAVDLVYLKNLIKEILPTVNISGKIHTDSKTADDLAASRTLPSDKAVTVAAASLRDMIRHGDITIAHLPGSANVADDLTKPTHCEGILGLMKRL